MDKSVPNLFWNSMNGIRAKFRLLGDFIFKNISPQFSSWDFFHPWRLRRSSLPISFMGTHPETFDPLLKCAQLKLAVLPLKTWCRPLSRIQAQFYLRSDNLRCDCFFFSLSVWERGQYRFGKWAFLAHLLLFRVYKLQLLRRSRSFSISARVEGGKRVPFEKRKKKHLVIAISVHSLRFFVSNRENGRVPYFAHLMIEESCPICQAS